MMKKEPLFLVFCLAIASCLAEAEVCIALMHPMDLRSALLIHTATTTLLVLWSLYLSEGYSYRFSLLLLVTTAVLGILGPFIVLVALASYVLSKPTFETPSEWIAKFFSPEFRSESSKLQERLKSTINRPMASHCIEPYQDILANGTVIQKQMAIAKMTRYFRPQFAPLLLQAARNPEPAVRVQAATALANIERTFMAKHMKVENDLKEHQNSAFRQLELAKLYDDYAYTGLADEESRNELREKAAKLYVDYIAQTDDTHASALLARLYLRQGLANKAGQVLTPLLNSEEITPEIAAWYMESLFQQHRFKELRHFAVSYAAKHKKPIASHSFQKLGDMFEVWSFGFGKENAA